MRQIQRLSIISVLSLLPATAMSGPPDDSAPSTQGQSIDGRTQDQGQDTQSQTTPPPGPPPGGWGAPTIEVNPQIQVQVNPKLDVEAKPTANADSDANANANAEANPKADATADIDTDISSEVDMDAASEGTGEPAPAATPTPPPKKVTKVKIIHRPVPEHYGPKPDRPPQRRSGLMVAGLFTFGGTYIGTAMNGAYMIDKCERARDEAACRQIATKMLIPVAGPFMAISDSTVNSNRAKLGLLGGAQAAGVLMTVAGAVMHVRDGKKNRAITQDGVRVGNKTRLAPMAGKAGGGLKVNVRF